MNILTFCSLKNMHLSFTFNLQEYSYSNRSVRGALFCFKMSYTVLKKGNILYIAEFLWYKQEFCKFCKSWHKSV